MDLGGDSIAGSVPTPVDLALDQLSVSLDHLVKLVEDGGLESIDDAQLLRVDLTGALRRRQEWPPWLQRLTPVSYTHLTLPTTPYV